MLVLYYYCYKWKFKIIKVYGFVKINFIYIMCNRLICVYIS